MKRPKRLGASFDTAADASLRQLLENAGWTYTGASNGARVYERGRQHFSIKAIRTSDQLNTAKRVLEVLDAKMNGCDRIAALKLAPKPVEIESSISKWIGAHDRKKEGGEPTQ